MMMNCEWRGQWRNCWGDAVTRLPSFCRLTNASAYEEEEEESLHDREVTSL